MFPWLHSVSLGSISSHNNEGGGLKAGIVTCAQTILACSRTGDRVIVSRASFSVPLLAKSGEVKIVVA